MKTKARLVIGASVASLSLFTGVTSASAADWPISGVFDVPGTMGGGATWSVYEYGIGTVTNTPNTMTTRIDNPNLVYGGADYTFCGSAPDYETTSTVTYESNGDITIDCSPVTGIVEPGLVTTIHLRLYAESATGYLARQWVELKNTSDQVVDMTTSPMLNYFFWNAAWTAGNPRESNLGDATVLHDGDVWMASGSNTAGDQIATAAAWGDTVHSDGYVLRGSEMTFPAEAQVIQPGQTVNLITFMNVVFPATNDAAGAQAAYALALSAARDELALGLHGRLITGLPDCLQVTGWVPAPCAALANTGVDATVAGGIAAGAGALALLGLGLVVARRRAQLS